MHVCQQTIIINAPRLVELYKQSLMHDTFTGQLSLPSPHNGAETCKGKRDGGEGRGGEGQKEREEIQHENI